MADEIVIKYRADTSAWDSAVEKIGRDVERLDRQSRKENKGAGLKNIASETQKAGQGVDNLDKKSKSLGKTLLGVGGIIAGAFAINKISGFVNKSVEDFKKFEASMKELQAITGATDESLEFFKQKALETGKATTTSATDYLNAVKLIASAQPVLLDQPENLDKVTQSARTLAEAAGLDLPTAATALTDAMNQFGADASQANRFINVLAAGSQKGAAEVPQVTEALLKFGVAAKSSNISVEESVALIETLAEKGLKGAESGTALRNVLAKLSAVEILPKEALASLEAAGVDISKLSDTTIPLGDRLKELSKIQNDATALTRVFGLENKNAAQSILQSLPRYEELIGHGDDLKKSIVGTNVAFEQAAKNQESAAAQSEILDNKMEALRIEMGEQLTPVMNGLKDAYVSFVGALVEGANDIQNAINHIKEMGEALETLEKEMPNTIKALKDFGATSIENAQKASNALKLLSQGQVFLKDATKETQGDAEKLKQQLESGAISVEEFQKKAYALYQLEIQRKKATKDLTDATVTETQAVEDAGDAAVTTADKTKKALTEMQKALLEFNKTMELARQEDNKSAINSQNELNQSLSSIIDQSYADQSAKDEEARKKNRTDYKESLLRQADDTESSFQSRRAALDKLHEDQLISIQDYNDKSRELSRQEAEAAIAWQNFKVDQFAQIGQNLSDIVKNFLTIAAIDAEQNAEFQKIAAAFEISIRLATSLANVIAGATQAAAAGGPAAPFLLAGYITSGVGAVLGAFAQAKQLLTETPPTAPAFAEGTEMFKTSGTWTSDSGWARLSNGERVVTAEKNHKYWDELHAIHNDTFDDFIDNAYIAPAVKQAMNDMKEMDKKSFADNLAASLTLQSAFSDKSIVQSLKIGENREAERHKKLIKTIQTTGNKRVYRKK